LDELDQLCGELRLSREDCDRIREVAGRMCRLEGGGFKRRASEYNIFIGKCVKSEKGPITERFRRCVERWKRGER
jgi:hypothetical protein